MKSWSRTRTNLWPLLACLAIASLAPPLGAASVDLATVIAGQSSVTLTPANDYYLPPTGYDVTANLAISGGGATVTIKGNPLKVSGATLTISNCTFVSGTGWGLLAAIQTGTMVLNNCGLTGNGSNTGLYASETATLRATGCTVQSCQYGLNAANTPTIELTNTSFSTCSNSIQQSAGSLTWNGGAVSQSSGSAVFVNGGEAEVSNVTVTQSAAGSIGFNVNNAEVELEAVSVDQSVAGGIGYQQSAGTLTWDGGTVSQSSGVGVSMLAGTVDISDVSVVQTTSGGIGFNFLGSTSGALHDIGVQGADHGVQMHEGTFTVDSGSTFVGGHGSGIAVNDGGTLTVRDSAFTNYQNAIDIQSHSPGGTADVEGCTFLTADYSAFSAVDAHDVRVARSTIQNSLADGVYFRRSTGVVENCQVTDSVMTGVTFMGCETGSVVVRNCLIRGSGHQGVAIVVDDGGTNKPTLNAQILNNTIVGNVLCNLLIDSVSTAYMQGNIFSQAPDYSIRFQGTKGITLDSSLVAESFKGIEMQNSNARVNLSSIAGHNSGGVLAYQNASPTFRGTNLRCNDTGGATHDYSLFVTENSTAHLRGCTLGLCGEWGVYNNSSGLFPDACYNYWGSDQGPKVQWTGSSPGASVEWNYESSPAVVYSPWLTQESVKCSYTPTLSLSSGVTQSWDSGFGVTLDLTAKTGIADTGGQMAGALQCLDVSELGMTLPTGFIAGQLYSVWVACPLREAAQQGTLTLSAPGVTLDEVGLMRRQADGSWTGQNATWSQVDRRLSFPPSDTDLLNGTFALVAGATGPPTPTPLSADRWELFE